MNFKCTLSNFRVIYQFQSLTKYKHIQNVTISSCSNCSFPTKTLFNESKTCLTGISDFRPRPLSSFSLDFVRFKSKRTKNKKNKSAAQEESSDDDEEPEEEQEFDKDSKIITVQAHSMRLDAIIKSGLNMARNKAETTFYESRIRINGEKALKKSSQVNVGDQIDVIRGTSVENDKFLTIARLEVLSAQPKNEGLSISCRRYKSLLVENYPNSPWTGAA